MNILVTGAKGQLGSELYQASLGTERDTYFFTDVEDLDITDASAIRAMVKDKHIELIINCAAYTQVDKAEGEGADLCERINHYAVRHLAEAMKEVEGWLVHISTDYVFGLEPYNTPCREDQQGTPTGVYGASKLRGEQAILVSGVKHLIFRTAWLYSPYGQNFLKTMLALTASREEVRVVFDQTGTPTYAADLAHAIYHIVEVRQHENHAGIYHYSNEGTCSWYDFAHAIAQLAGHDRCSVLPCYSSDYPSPVKRPAYSVFDKSKFKETFGLPVPHWRDALVACLKAMDIVAPTV
ncbi:MAG: dTDP-4-dehydrorhamnose reductase [Bacteroidales bacterium]|nr:dTDP-4-dehydrorhamnose reductase [Bacteroidales bacterium]